MAPRGATQLRCTGVRSVIFYVSRQNGSVMASFMVNTVVRTSELATCDGSHGFKSPVPRAHRLSTCATGTFLIVASVPGFLWLCIVSRNTASLQPR